MKNLTSNTPLWDRSLTSKLLSLLKIKPILDIKDVIIRDDQLKDHYKHYDPLAVILKTLEVIIDNMGYKSGITQEDLYDDIIPLLERMDIAKLGQPLARDLHMEFIDHLLDRLLLQAKKEGIRLAYTDYSVKPPREKELPFRLISYRNFGEDIVLIAENPTVNFFLQMLDINLEDQQTALMKILERQIDRGDFSDALQTARNYIRITKQYLFKIEATIERLHRNIRTVDWLRFCQEELKKSTEHIKDCIDQQTKEFQVISRKLAIVVDEESTELQYLTQLKESLAMSMNLLLPLQTRVSEARDTFRDEQWGQIYLRKRQGKRLQLEEQVLDKILPLTYGDFRPLFEKMVPFFGHSNVPPIFTYQQLVNLTIKQIQRKTPVKSIIKTRIEYKMVAPLYLNQYPLQVKKEGAAFLMEQLGGKPGKTLLSEVLIKAEQRGMDFLVCNYLRLLIVGNYAVKGFEKDIFPETMNIQVVDSLCETKYFFGNDYLIEKLGDAGNDLIN